MTTTRKSGEKSPERKAPTYGSTAGRRMTASASTVKGRSDDGRVTSNTRATADQVEAELMFTAIGEIRKIVSARGAMLSACTFSIGLQPEPDDDEGRPLYDDEGRPLDPSVSQRTVQLAEERLLGVTNILGSQGALVDAISQNWDVSGEAYLAAWWTTDAGTPVEENSDTAKRVRWEVFGPTAYRCESGKHKVRFRRGDTEVTLPESTYVVRLWKRHPSFPDEPHGWVMSALPTCRSLLAYSLAERSQALSSAIGKIHLVPSEAAPLSPNPEGHEAGSWAIPEPGDVAPMTDADAWAIKLDEMIAEVISEVLDDWQSGRAVQGGVLAVEGKWLELFGKSIDLGRDVDAGLGAMTDRALQRLREQADCSPEMISGLGDTNRWNGKQIDESDYRRYHRPQIEAIAEAWTAELIWPTLRAASVPEDELRKLRVIVNKAAIVAPPDRSAIAGQALMYGAIGRAGYRFLTDIPDRLKPDDDELEELKEYFAKSTAKGIGGGGGGSNPPAEVNPVNEDAGSITPSTRLRVVAAASEPPLGELLISIEQATRDTLEAAGSVVFDAALARANAKARNLARRHLKVDVPAGTVDVFGYLGPARTAAVLAAEYDGDEDRLNEEVVLAALVGFRRRFGAIAEKYHGRVLGALGMKPPTSAKPSRSPFTGASISLSTLADTIDSAWNVLTDSVVSWVRDTIEKGGDAGVIPDSIWRRVTLTLGGEKVKPGTGAVAIDASSKATAGVFGEAFAVLQPEIEWQRWHHLSVKPNPFPEHKALNGQLIEGPEDPVLAGAPWGSYWPGDHRGCMCDVIPVFATDNN